MKQPEHEAVIQARRKSDWWVLGIILGIISIVLTILFYTGLSLAMAGSDLMYDQSTGTVQTVDEYLWSVGGYAVALGVLLVVMLVLIRVMRQQFLGNALQVEYSNYAWLRDWSNQVAADLQMPRVEIFVTQDPVINAYALGFRRPYNIVLHSGSVRYLSRDELKAIVVHEMAHVKYRHTQWQAYLSVITALPLVGAVAGWLVSFWARRAELTADRLALCYMRDVDLVKNALVKVHVGPDVASSFNAVARQWQEHMTDNTFNHFSQTFSSHPFLVRRLQHLDRCADLVAPKEESHAAAA